MKNEENVHNPDVKDQICEKLREIETLVPLPSSYEEMACATYSMLLEALSHEEGKILCGRYMFLTKIFEEKATVISYGPEIQEIAILYMILSRLREQPNQYELFRTYVDENVEVSKNGDTYSYKLYCLNGRIARYFASLCYTDENAILARPFSDDKERRCYILTKIYHIFNRLLMQYPAYYAAYNGKGPDPIDYDKCIKKLFNIAVQESGESFDFPIDDILEK